MDFGSTVPAALVARSCLSDDEAAALAAGALVDDEWRIAMGHLDSCEHCRRTVSALAALADSRTTMRDAPWDLDAGSMLGRFVLTRPLGNGAMGEVWAARDPALDREVALKLLRLRSGAIGTDATARMRREAQAMARLNHPNVVAIYELGTDEAERVFCAMELVDGVTLRDWLVTPRSFRTVIPVALSITRGVVAAHAAGLIHRDIKPENVLIAHDGRTLVSDFGLAKLTDLGSEAPPEVPSDASTSSATLTAAGAVMGTPLYMSPEQLAGQIADARSDQFSCCVTIYEALFGGRPFAGQTIDELIAAIERGPLRPRHLHGTPRGVWRCLARGLAADPAKRWPSMAEFAAALDRASRRPRQLAAAGIGLVAVAAAVGVTLVVSRTGGSGLCAQGDDLIDGMWNPAIRAEQTARFTRTSPAAGVTIASTAQLIDRWTSDWKLDRRAVCTLDEPQRAARLACLERGLHELHAQLALWRDADAAVIQHAVGAASTLPGPGACAAAAAGDPIAPGVADQATRINALVRSGRMREASERVDALLAVARATGSPHDLAIALVSASRAVRETGQLARAKDLLVEAAREAGRAGDDQTLLDALASEASVITELGQPQVSLGLLDAAQAIDERTGKLEQVELAVIRGDALQTASRTQEAIATLRAALPVAEAAYARDPRKYLVYVTSLGLLGAALRDTERYDEARPLLERMVALNTENLGPDHPETARALGDLATIEARQQRLADAKRHVERARAIAVATNIEHDPLAGTLDLVAADVAMGEGDDAGARALYERARGELTGVLAPDHPRFAAIESGLGQLDRGAGDCKSAVPHYERALHVLEVSGQDRRSHALLLTDFGYCLGQVGRVEEARNALQRSLAEIADLSLPKGWSSEPWAALADLEIAAGHKALAIELERKAIADIEHETKDPATAQLRQYEMERLAEWTK